MAVLVRSRGHCAIFGARHECSLTERRAATAPMAADMIPNMEGMRSTAAGACAAGAALLGCAGLLLCAAPTARVAAADELPTWTVVIANHRFIPAELHIPRGIKVRLIIDNQGNEFEEFDSHSLNREKHIPPRTQVSIFVGPLPPGRYLYESESDTAGGPSLGVIDVE